MQHCKNCRECVLQNQGNSEQPFGHFTALEGPMQFICMDLVGPIQPTTSKGNRFCMTVMDMLTGYTIAVPIRDKTAESICQAYRDHVYCTFGGSSRMLTDNGSEFKNKEMDAVCEISELKAFTHQFIHLKAMANWRGTIVSLKPALLSKSGAHSSNGMKWSLWPLRLITFSRVNPQRSHHLC